jgi:FHA domain
MAKLIAQSGHSLDLPRRRVTLGESLGCDIPLTPGLGLAAVHFEIEPTADGNYVLRDVSAGAGTLVNGNAVREAVLQHGNVIGAGALQLGFWNTDLPQQTDCPFLAGARSKASGDSVQCPDVSDGLSTKPAGVQAVPNGEPMVPAGPVAEESVAAPVPPPVPVSVELPPAWVSPAELNTVPAVQGAGVDPSGKAVVPAPIAHPAATGTWKPRWAKSVRRFRFPSRRAAMVASLAMVSALGAVAVRTPPVQSALSPLWLKFTAWTNPPKPLPRVPANASAEPAEQSVAQSAIEAVTPKADHNDVVKRMLTERTLSLFQADLRQLVPFYNASAGARNLPPQREMTEAFRKHYGILLDGFDRLTCLRAKGKDEFVFVLTSATRVDIAAVLGSAATTGKERGSSASKEKSFHIYPVKTSGRVYGVAQYDPFTVILGSRSWIEGILHGNPGPSLREALCMFPDTASRNPGALIMVERIVPPPDSTSLPVFQTAISNLFFNGKGESRLTLTRNPDVKEEVFVEQSSAALKEQASSLIQAVKLSESLMVGSVPAKSAVAASPGGDTGEVISTAEASIVIPDGEALLREAIDSVAHSFMSQSPSVELILAAQKAVLNFNQARLHTAPETQSVTSVSEALELLQNGIVIAGRGREDLVFQIERLEAAQAGEIVHLLALEDKAGLVFRPNTDHLQGSMLELAVKARDYRNAELLISLWAAAKFTAADAPDVNAAVRKVTEWANNDGSRQRLSVGLPILTAAEYKNAVALLSIQNGQLTWKPGEEGYRTWLRRMNPDPKGDAKRIAVVFHAAQKAGAIPRDTVRELADAVCLINSGVRVSNGSRSVLYNTGNLTVDELRAAARYLRLEGGAMRVVDW